MNGLFQEEKRIRFEELVKTIGRNPTDFAKKIGSTQSVVRKAITTGVGISPALIEKITNRFKNVDPVWILTGRGEMFLGGQNQMQVAEPTESYNKEGNMAPALVDMTTFIRDVHEMKSRISALEKDVAALFEENKVLRGLVARGLNGDKGDDKKG